MRGFIRRHVKLLLLIAALMGSGAWYIVERERDYFTHLNRVTKKFIDEIEREHGLSCFSIGGAFSGNIKAVTVKFFCYEKKPIEEARKLEVACVERFCEMINSHKKIRPSLEEFPFPSHRAEIMICFCDRSLKNYNPEESIGSVLNCKKNLVYTIEFNDSRPNETVLREPYSEAYAKVRGSR